ncbi:MAG: TlyA family RNA methyltransferase [Pseudomonadota bacterium]|nr:TlyA family RNA methyltransferase [Pseudomonadota bacterium]
MENSEKIRLDQALVELGLVKSRTLAQRMIEAGQVFIQRAESTGHELVEKPSMQIFNIAKIKSAFPKLHIIEGNVDRYVSRGGLKMRAALDFFEINPSGLRVMDIGISTGGFTDCLLQAGAAKVVGIDVGHGQTAPSILKHPNVEVHEGINARELGTHDYLAPFDLIVLDVSFISLTKVVPEVVKFLKGQAYLLALVKPQYELEQEGGHLDFERVKLKIYELFEGLQFGVQGYFECPVKGGAGNQEFFIYAKKN